MLLNILTPVSSVDSIPVHRGIPVDIKSGCWQVPFSSWKVQKEGLLARKLLVSTGVVFC